MLFILNCWNLLRAFSIFKSAIVCFVDVLHRVLLLWMNNAGFLINDMNGTNFWSSFWTFSWHWHDLSVFLILTSRSGCAILARKLATRVLILLLKVIVTVLWVVPIRCRGISVIGDILLPVTNKLFYFGDLGTQNFIQAHLELGRFYVGFFDLGQILLPILRVFFLLFTLKFRQLRERLKTLFITLDEILIFNNKTLTQSIFSWLALQSKC